MNKNTTLLQMGRNAITRLLSAPPSGGLLRKAATLLCAALAVNTAADAQSTTFNYTGSSQTYTATSTGTLVIDMAGAKGGNKFGSGTTQIGGNGGRVVCSLAVTSGQVLNIYVGGQGQTQTVIANSAGGYNGGGVGTTYSSSYTAGGGGGASDIRIGGTALANRVVVAGGGGGAGLNTGGEAGGPGGGLTGGNGYNAGSNTNGICGKGGTQSAGGAGGTYPGYPGGAAGSLGNGGIGGTTALGGGGGGGYYGGGGGSFSGAGGGSSFTHATLCTGVTHTQGYNAGNGYVILTPVVTAKEALNFDGSNDIVIAPNNSSTQLTSGTVEAWFKTSNAGSGWRGIVAKQHAYGLFLYDNELVAYDWNTGSNMPTGIYPNDGNWHHVAMTFQSGVTNGSSIYLDGVFVRNFTMAVVNQTIALAVAGGTDAIGGYQSFTGSIDEVRVWNTIRTGTEISTNKDCDIAASSALKLYYRFNDGTAGGTNTSLTKVVDYSGNGNCGNIYGMALTGGSSNFVTGAIGTCNSIAVSAANTGTATVCVGNTTTLSNSVNGGTWSSSNGAVATVGSTTGVVTGVAGGTAVISYITCNATNTTIVTVNALPTVGAGSGVAICTGSSTTLSATGASTYTWAPGTGLSATVGSSVTAGPTSLTTYTVTGTDALGCTNTATKVVSVNALPSVSAGSGVAICIGSSTTISATGASTYTWAPGTGLSATTGTSVTANPTTLTTYTVTGTDGNGCVNTATKVVTVNPLPTNTIASFTPSPTIAGLPVSFTVSNVSLSSYSWNFGDATSSTTMNPTKAYATSGTFIP
ncbi:MAG: hypothetical protein JNM41_04735, partial [Flavipsychrobacter sp.]|nr:hypothetical protein [Flavipsychrobacter sp.]